MCLQPFCKVMKDHTLRVMDIPGEFFFLLSIFGILIARMLVKRKPWGPFSVKRGPIILLWTMVAMMLFAILTIILAYLDLAQQKVGPILLKDQLVCGMKVYKEGSASDLGYSSGLLKGLSWVGVVIFGIAALWNVDIMEKLEKIKEKWRDLQEQRKLAQQANSRYESTGLVNAK